MSFFAFAVYTDESRKIHLRVGLASWLLPGHSLVVRSMTNRRLLRGFCHLASDTPPRHATLPGDTTVPWWGGRQLHFEFA